ncbi:MULTISPECIES: hypothetical protein [unclassified Peribacillus]|uniref:hypothetical protein n=1 Tax=unclassified Peribacillus TaxID=2675266 RepID=UPI00366D3486
MKSVQHFGAKDMRIAYGFNDIDLTRIGAVVNQPSSDLLGKLWLHPGRNIKKLYVSKRLPHDTYVHSLLK